MNKYQNYTHTVQYNLNTILTAIAPKIEEILTDMPSMGIGLARINLLARAKNDPIGSARDLVLDHVKIRELWAEFFAALENVGLKYVVDKWFPNMSELYKASEPKPVARKLPDNSLLRGVSVGSLMPIILAPKEVVPKEIKNEANTAEGEKPCQICFERSRKCVIFPCKHSGLCVTCARDMEQKIKAGTQVCPFCRETVTEIISFFDV